MKSFQSWVGDMANSIEDASTIVKDEFGNVLPTSVERSEPKGVIYDDIYEKWAERHEAPYYDYDDN